MNKILTIFVLLISILIVHGIWTSQDRLIVCEGKFDNEDAREAETLAFKAEIHPWWFHQKKDIGQVRVQTESGGLEYLNKLQILDKSGDWIFESTFREPNTKSSETKEKGMYYGLVKTIKYYDSAGWRFDGNRVEH